MSNDSKTLPDPFDQALLDWRNGRYEAALAGLRTATTGGDAGCASLLLQMSADPSAPAGAKPAAAETVFSAPDTPPLRRHGAFIRASGYGVTADPAAALAQRIEAARNGDALAMTEIALLSALMTDGAAPADPPLCGPLLETAAEAGSAAAIAALLRLALETGRISPVARRLAPALGRSGHPLASALITATTALPEAAATAPSGTAAPDWPAAEPLLAAILEPAAPAETIHPAPRVARSTGFLPAMLCDYLAAQAASLLKPAQVFDPLTGQPRPDPYRQSLTAALPDGAMDLVLWAIKMRMAMLAGGTFDQGEPLAVLLYRPGDQYRPHVDYLSDTGPVTAADLARRGQRIATTLVRLNQEFSGGATVFPRLDISWTGASGDALSFANTDAAGQGDPMSLHAGEPVQAGVKILASLWLRERA
ncbi:prolyl hydroxylase family protein [Maricaulis sp.]|uniref:prolyl hydroxylase family protein n=1 Tax=Maricaulis sp. TaxID=1486257 RepID=UPI003A92A383